MRLQLLQLRMTAAASWGSWSRSCCQAYCGSDSTPSTTKEPAAATQPDHSLLLFMCEAAALCNIGVNRRLPQPLGPPANAGHHQWQSGC